MSNWLEEKIKDTWRWDRLKWPSGLDVATEGEYRIYEKPQYGEQRFFPQWRLSSCDGWKNWLRMTWGRCGSAEPVNFPMLHQAQAWLDEAHRHRPRIVAHKYEPHDI